MRAKKTAYEKELARLEKEEQAFRKKYADKTDSALNRFLADKIPAGLQSKLDVAFAKAFRLIFEKGTGIIEKSYRREEREKQFQIDHFTAQVRQDRKSLKRFSKKALGSKNVNMAVSGAAGMGMGFLGVGLPDIPLFTGFLLKSLYEIALSFGYDYKKPEEQDFILRLIHGAVSHGADYAEANRELDYYIETGEYRRERSREELIRNAAGGLSMDLLYMKFVQGLPIVGLIGGAYDAVYIQRIGRYAELKYRKRLYRGMKK